MCKIVKGCLFSSNQSTDPHPPPSAEAHPHARNPAAKPLLSSYRTSSNAKDTPRTHPQSIPVPAALPDADRHCSAPPAAPLYSPGKPAPPSPPPPSPHPASEPRSPHTTVPTHSHNTPFMPAHEMLNSVHKTHGHTSQTKLSADSAVSA